MKYSPATDALTRAGAFEPREITAVIRDLSERVRARDGLSMVAGMMLEHEIMHAIMRAKEWPHRERDVAPRRAPDRCAA